MKVLEFLLVLAVLAGVVVVVGMPLRRGRIEETERREAAELAELEAAKEAKYREIRDAEMDFRTGKLSKEDHRALDRALRAEAIQLLRRIDALKPAAEADTRGASRADAADAPGDAASPADDAATDATRSDARVG
ncbi:hypothetical protein VSS74_02675 [Conexibacter stalactiti]|uniref:C-type cytochrome biogenesis protein CcmI n=1 Tax=Conexibacter stalactiti TaxID=1940611 RepID=A0ABU4HIS8_9ACTN|nr:hypothetical protein [Conexibacter stalactiti]MDW5593226.1 hypothetical protein [Conexibacter stalactiti]MEC5033867.1 hypothetical protein [Conexibacter stalactiti]